MAEQYHLIDGLHVYVPATYKGSEIKGSCIASSSACYWSFCCMPLLCIACMVRAWLLCLSLVPGFC